MRFFSFFERLVDATGAPPAEPIPSQLGRFYWCFLRQMPGLMAGLVTTAFVVAALDASVPALFGWLVTVVSTHERASIWREAWPDLFLIAVVVGVLRPLALVAQTLLANQTLAPGLGNLVRWQIHWHVARRVWTFFQNDFAGSVANRVVNTGPSLRETVLLATTALWYLVVYGGSAMLLLASSDAPLTVPVACWFAGYALLLWYYVPRIRVRSREVSAVRSVLTGRLVDCYANIVTLKLYSRQEREDDYIRGAIDEHTVSYRRHLRLTTELNLLLSLLNAAMIVSASALAVGLWSNGRVEIGAIAMTLPLTWQIASIAGRVTQHATSLFENMGVVEDGMRTIAAPTIVERANCRDLSVTRGGLEFEDVRFGYEKSRPVLDGVDLTVAPGERVGLIGESGAGKSTLLHLALRLFELDGGRIRIDGQDIADVSLASLWRQIAVVTQDTALLNRSIRDNIRLGKPDASDDELREIARRVHALDFIDALRDGDGNCGFDACMGERGMKLSGGQRQRIVIARAALKNAPILLLDEATSALDDATESAVQEQLFDLMRGRTVIAIAHRLTTLANMDRVIRLENGRIFEVPRRPGQRSVESSLRERK